MNIKLYSFVSLFPLSICPGLWPSLPELFLSVVHLVYEGGAPWHRGGRATLAAKRRTPPWASGPHVPGQSDRGGEREIKFKQRDRFNCAETLKTIKSLKYETRGTGEVIKAEGSFGATPQPQHHPPHSSPPWCPQADPEMETKPVICGRLDSALSSTHQGPQREKLPGGPHSHLYCPPVLYISWLPVITPSLIFFPVEQECMAPHFWPVEACSEGLGSV